MSTRSGSGEQFGNYLLFRKLETDSLGDLWRAAPLETAASGTAVALRKFTGGNRVAFVQSVTAAAKNFPRMSASGFVKGQRTGVVDGVPYLVHEYASGRSLRYIIDHARGGGSKHPSPLPTEQAVAIAERIASSLEATGNLKDDKGRLTHGALIPQFVWISDDGDIRIAGQGLSRALQISMAIPEVRRELGPYFAPELEQAGSETKQTEVFSVGAILFLMLTGTEPPPAGSMREAIESAHLMAGGEPIPDDLRKILQKSFVENPSSRFESVAELRENLGKLVHGGSYAPTTFNLAFYLSSLLKKEYESDHAEQERELKLPVATHEEKVVAPPAVVASRTASVAIPATEGRKLLPIGLGAVALLVIGGGTFYALNRRESPPAPAVAAPVVIPPPAVSPAVTESVAEPIVSEVPKAGAPGAPALTDAEQRKAFEAEVNRRLQKEMLRMQADADEKVRRATPTATSAAISPPPAAPARRISPPVEEPSPPSAASLDQARREPTRAELPPPAAAVVTPAPSVQLPAVSERSAVNEGDLVELLAVDEPPKRVRTVAPVYPPMAMRQKAEGTLILSALISEKGRVLDVKILRGDARGLGLNEAAERAVRSCQFTPAMKDGKRVKTWTPVPITFKAK